MRDTEFNDINIMLQEEQDYYNDMMRITLEAMNSLENYTYDIDEDDLPF
jgi:hypothetical protein